MMKNNPGKLLLLAILIVISLSLSVAAAVSVNVDKSPPDYDRSANRLVTATASCANQKSTIEIINSEGNFIYIKGGEGSWSLSYNTKSDPADGKYRAEAKCEDGTSATAEFCVNRNGCTSSGGGGGGSGGGGGGGGSCTSVWQCSTWSTCSVQGQQTRQCTDTRCRRDPRMETQPCQCRESWTCREWSSCQNGQQTRICNDEHACGTVLSRPATQQSCSTGFVNKIKETFFPPEPRPALPATPEVSRGKQLWDDYGVMALSAVAALLALIIILIIVHKHKKKKVSYNLNDLKEWIRAEKRMGTPDGDIREILMDKTGWTVKEINSAFQGLGGEGNSTAGGM